MQNNWLKIILSSFVFCITTVCGALPANLKIYTVLPASTAKSYLYFQGNIEPLQQRRVLSPVMGVVNKPLNFVYGNKIKKGQYLLSLQPSDQQNSYRTSLLAYLRAKSSYSEALAKFSGQELLYKNKILARNDFQQVKNNLNDQKLALQEALFNLQATITKMSSNGQEKQQLLGSLANLSLNDQHVYSELNRSFSEVKVYAPSDGVALLPPKSSASDAGNTALQVDSVVKLEQPLLSIGDFSGVKVNVSVSEVSINKLQQGQVAEVTGPAFPGVVLKGSVSSISYQASTNSYAGSIPEFPVTIMVPTLSAQQQKLIHAGMTAQVKIALTSNKQIQVPIAAVSTHNGESTVQKIVHGKLVTTPVVTGTTGLSNVVIIKGLVAGDKIALPH